MHPPRSPARRALSLWFVAVLIATAFATPAPGTEPSPGAARRSCVAIDHISYDPAGGSRRAANGEWIQLTNSCRKARSLDGWKITGSRAGAFTFSDYRLAGGALVRVYTGKGRSTPAYRYWGKRRPVWDDTRATARLVTARGKVADACSYDGLEAGEVSCTRFVPAERERDDASFRVECDFSHRKQVDPIVRPGPSGTRAHHQHDFFGNTSVDSDSTYRSMTRAGTTCGLGADRAGYWVPSLVGPAGDFVDPDVMIVYYRARPSDYATPVPFPRDLRMIAGGEGTYPHAYWTCEGQSDSALETRSERPPTCGTARVKLHVYFPSCWDGVRNDSPDHRAHVAYAFDDDDGTSTDISDDTCPRSHPVKIPQVHVRVLYPVRNAALHRLSDGTTAPHADFWNTWKQPALERLVRKCLRREASCGLQEDR